MEEKKSTTTTGGIGFAGLLTIAFIILKLCGVIAWSWLWVLSPVWITAAIVVIILIAVIIVAVIIAKKPGVFLPPAEKRRSEHERKH